jgi:menaquinone-dependent protoporphyrinogen oxidase
MGGTSILVVFETGEGHTRTVAEALRDRFEALGHDAVLKRARDATAADAGKADGIVVAASIHMGKHARRAVRFARARLEALHAKPSAFVSVSLSARSEDPALAAQVEGYLKAFREETGWAPAMTVPVAGALLYTRYGFLKRWILRSIMKKEGGDTDTSRDFVYTNWDAVKAFAGAFSSLVSKAGS